jgi:hypothetical protein
MTFTSQRVIHVLDKAYAISQLPSFCEFSTICICQQACLRLYSIVKGIVSRDEYFLKAYNNKKVLYMR